MDVILLERIEKLGQIGDVVSVKAGFARNFLLPRKKALRATEDNKKRFEEQRAQIEATNLKRRQEAEKIAKKVDGLKIVVIRQASETGMLFGSVANRDIADGVTAAGFTVDRRQVILDKPIKTLGLHKVRLALHPEVIVTVTANVAKSEDEAAQQEKLGAAVVKTEGETPDLDKLLEEAAQATAGAGEQPAAEA
ncbi:MAG: 50S ribosomal protein L9 [Rhodospirillaceae bacterium]|jgi:large subunit ribosomal protein L9|nr:50S ribosomal protein L9 [Rhodospirillaceae bacterium]